MSDYFYRLHSCNNFCRIQKDCWRPENGRKARTNVWLIIVLFDDARLTAMFTEIYRLFIVLSSSLLQANADTDNVLNWTEILAFNSYKSVFVKKCVIEQDITTLFKD